MMQTLMMMMAVWCVSSLQIIEIAWKAPNYGAVAIGPWVEF